MNELKRTTRTNIGNVILITSNNKLLSNRASHSEMLVPKNLGYGNLTSVTVRQLSSGVDSPS